MTAPGETRAYAWDALYPGTFPYHGLDPVLGIAKGEGPTRGHIGAVVVHAPDEAPANVHLVALSDFNTDDHSSLPGASDPGTRELPDAGTCRGSHEYMHTIDGKACDDAVAPFTRRVGELSRWRLVSIGRKFRGWHIRGHRWLDAAGALTDNVLLGHSSYGTLSFAENNPGSWPVQCHLPDHTGGGMIHVYGGRPLKIEI